MANDVTSCDVAVVAVVAIVIIILYLASVKSGNLFDREKECRNKRIRSEKIPLGHRVLAEDGTSGVYQIL